MTQIRATNEREAVILAQKCNALDVFPMSEQDEKEFSEAWDKGVELLGGGLEACGEFWKLCQEQKKVKA